jgi:hypothetical protein
MIRMSCIKVDNDSDEQQKVGVSVFDGKMHRFRGLISKVEEAIRFDEESGTPFWQDAIWKEMGGNILPAVKILEPNTSPPVGSQLIPCHIVFDIKMDFTRKHCYVAGGTHY